MRRRLSSGADRVPGARRGQGRRGDAGELAVVAVAAQPRVLGGDLPADGGGGDVEVVRDLAALAGAFEPAQEAPPLGLAAGRV